MKQKLRNRVLPMLLSLCLILAMVPTVAAASSPSYAALGDSISFGTGLETGESNFATIVAANTYELDNLSNEGEDSAALLEKLQNPSSAELAVVKGADLITITIGGNDLMNALYSFIAEKYNEGKQESQQITGLDVIQALTDETSPIRMQVLTTAFLNISSFPGSMPAQTAVAQFSQNFGAILGIIREENPNATVIVVNQYNPYSHLGSMGATISSAFEAGLQLLNPAITAVAEANHCMVADVYTAFANASENPCNSYFTSTADFNLDFHPNAYGHNLIAETINGVLPQTTTPVETLFVNNVDLLAGGRVDGVSYDEATNTLTLENAVIDTPTEEVGYSDGIFVNGDLNIVLKGENVIRGQGIDYGIDADPGSLNISGDGSLTVEAEYAAIYAENSITIGGTVDVTATGGDAAFYAANRITIGGESFHQSATSVVLEDGVLVKAFTPVTELWVNNVDLLAGGTVDGVSYDEATGTLTLENAVIDTPTEEVGYNDGIFVNGDLNIVLKGENVIRGQGIDYGIDAEPGSLNISGDGSLTIEAEYGAIYAENSITIGGTVDVTATGGDAALYAANRITIGGELLNRFVTRVVIEDGVLVEDFTLLTELWVNNVDLLAGGRVDGVSYDEATGILTLENATIDTINENYGTGIYAKGNLNIVLKGENVIRGDSMEAGIAVDSGSLNLSGDGSLTVEAEYNGIEVDDSIVISGTVDLVAMGGNASISSDMAAVSPNQDGAFYIWLGGDGENAILQSGAPFTEKTEIFYYGVDGIHKYPPYIRCCGWSGITTGCNISVSPAKLDFGTVDSGYGTSPEAQTVTVTNTGDASLQLTQPTAENYEIGALSSTVLAPGEKATFTVQPKTGLAAGNYAGEITVYADCVVMPRSLSDYSASEQTHDAFATLQVSFQVGQVYTLTFETNGGSQIDSVTKANGSVVSLENYQPSKEGYSFLGWYADESLTEKVTSVVLDGNKTVYAGWSKAGESISDTPQTGVRDNIILWIALLFVSGGAAGGVSLKKMRKSQK